jgi:poly-gamma-glutamate synthesis protein (capsule biosynthesis protein)
MIFLGDLVYPHPNRLNFLNINNKDFLSKDKILNFESVLLSQKAKKVASGISLFSSIESLYILKNLNVKAVSLANNHITDFALSLDEQYPLFLSHNISPFGAGENLEQAIKPFFYTENKIEYGVLAFGWEVIGCQIATNNTRGVNPLRYQHVINIVGNFIDSYPKKKLIVIFHWNYEFELYPQPAHRQLAHVLIDMGVSAIFGHHSHVVQGFEIYNGCPIFYGLGNFYLPEQNYDGYNLKYPEIAKIGLGVEYNDNISGIQLYWLYKDDNNKLYLTKKESLLNSSKMLVLSPFQEMSHKDYIIWFKKNRIKKKLLPIYKNYNELTFNKDLWVALRQKFIYFLVRINLKQNSRYIEHGHKSNY